MTKTGLKKYLINAFKDAAIKVAKDIAKEVGTKILHDILKGNIPAKDTQATPVLLTAPTG